MTDVAQRSIGYLVAGAIVAGLLLYVFGKIDAYQAANDADIVQASMAEVDLAHAHQRERAKLLLVQQLHERKLVSAQGRTDSLLADATPAIRAAVELERAECAVVVRTCNERATSAEADAARLAAQLQQQVKVSDHRWGVFVGVGPSAGPNGVQSWSVTLSFGYRLARLPRLLPHF